ncbi:LamG domain-containing protein [Plantactinospora sp. B24E8]|uniref:LamG domain-containing protein n=1 Tax=Plantactinospora sp. B24E8 TaxID=3153567 RepID=UPI00325D4585
MRGIMGGRAGLRWRAGAAVVVTVLAAVPPAVAVVERQEPLGAADRVRLSEAPEATTALAAARRQGSRVEAVELRTASRTVYAEPDGTMTAELDSRPVRAQRPDGTWTPVDPTLVRRPDGTVGPAVATVELSFSGGGVDTPLVRYGNRGGWLELSWPGRLPAPTLDGDTATYPEVLPGVDLRLRADVDGYAQYLVVKNRAAAANPKVRQTRLGLRTSGLTVRGTESGGLEARDRTGTVLFGSPASRMWDSGTPRRNAEVAVTVGRTTLTLRPDPKLLADPATRYPVTVDPLWHTADKQSWASVLSGNAGTSYWNSSGAPPWAQVGQCYVPSGECNGIGEAWTYWLFDTSFLTGRLIISADLNATVVASPNCTSGTHQLYRANAALTQARSSWNTRAGGTLVSEFSAPGVHTNCAGYKEVGLSVAGHVNLGGSTTFFVRAKDPADQLAWRRYQNNAQLRVNFNRVPGVPTDLRTDPPLPEPCRWCAGVRYVGDAAVRLTATLADPDGDQVQSLWRVNVGGAWYESRSRYVDSGLVHSYTVDTDGRHGQAVEWAVKAEDTARHGGDFAYGTRFVVDRQPPAAKPGVRGTLYQADNRWHGGVGVPDRFVFDSGGVGDVDHYRWGWTQDPTNVVPADALGGGATVELTPPGDGPRDLFVQSVDRAGHRGPVRQYHFYVRAGSGPLAQWSLDGGTTDDAWLGDRDATAVGAVTYGPGAVGQAARLDGTAAYLTAPPAVRTDTSFAVSAWVRLDSAGYARAVLSQSGTNFAGYVLWYRPEDGGRWAFGMPRSDAGYQGTDLATSAQPAQVGVWTQLTGVYDARARTLRLYVDGVLAGSAERTVPDWNATGWTQIGRTMWNGSAGVDHWPGLVDEVRVYDRALTADEVRASVGTDNVQVGHWRFDELTGGTGRNAVSGGEMLTLHGDAAFTGDGDGDGLADGGAVGGAVRLDGDDHAATAGPVLHTDRSFTVAGWVQLDVSPPAGQSATALSQDGAATSGFFLGYRDRPTGDVWEFATPGADATNAPGGAGIQSSTPAQPGVPTHLAAVHDADGRQIRLYVNGVLAGSAGRTDGFDATGPLVVGRGLDGGPAAYWTGWVDEVRAYSRALSEAEIQAVVSRDDVALGEWRLDGTAGGGSGHGGDGTLHGTPAWGAGQGDVPDPTDLAVLLSGDDHVTVPLTVDVRQSFSVAAWARLDEAGGTATVVSQDGSRVSAFQLMSGSDGRWAFLMPGSDADNGGVLTRVSGPTAQVGVWTHLVGGYDAGAGKLFLYVNGVPAGTAPHTQSWHHPAGGLQVGGGWWNGNRQNRLRGAIDDVTVYGRVLFAGEIRELAGRDLTLAHNWRLDEGSGGQAADAVGRRAATVAGGVTRTPGRLGNAVALNGTDGRLGTAGVDVRTDADFTVATWVQLDRTCVPAADQFECKLVAVSLDDPAGPASKFRLGHWRDRGQHADGVWVFEMPEPDGTITKAAVPVLPSDFGRWVHLAGVYDRATGKLWLYVNGTRKGDGTLNQPWQATGGLQIGRGRDAAGDPGQWFPGRVDDVRLYTGALDDGRIGGLYHSYPVQCGTIGAPTPCTLPSAGAGRWRFDENTGSTAADASGRGLDATLGGGADWTPGRIGHAGRFNGVDGYAQTAGPVLDTARGFSVSVWAYPGTETSAADQVIVAQTGTQSSAFSLYQDAGGRWAAATTTGDTAAPTVLPVVSTERVRAGHWTHLGLVYDATLRQLRLYVNGRLSAARTGVVTWSATGPLTIGRGRSGGTDGRYLTGAVDDVRAYPTALRDGELAEVYDDTSPAAYGNWTFDDNTVTDSSWRANPTSTTGAVSYVDGVRGRALSLDGESAATTGQLGVPTQASFTVSAWARLTHEPAVQTVLGQDGTRTGGFALRYDPSLDRWVFGAWTQDADAAEFRYARSDVAAVVGEWTHLTGVYDHAGGQLRLYVNGQLAGSVDGVTLWPATGGLTIGRGWRHGAPAHHFTGQIDEVRTDLGVVPDSEINQRAGRD